MALKVIGSGLGRTGTLSMKLALERLGFGPCHHMVEIITHPETAALWVAAEEGKPEWDLIFEGYRSAVDYPCAKYWRQLADFYPEAKVLHTVRDAESWFESTQATVFAPDSRTPPPHLKRFFEILHAEFGSRLHDRASMIDYFHRQTAEVERAIPKERLLVHRMGEGWDRLCAFLGVPVPDEPFPSVNSRNQYVGRARDRDGVPEIGKADSGR